MKKRTIALILAMLVAILTGCGGESPDSTSDSSASNEEIREMSFAIAHNAGTGGGYDIACKKIAELMGEYSGGKMTLEVHGDGALGSETDALELVKSGSIDMSVCGASTMAATAKSMNVFNLPYLFKDYDHVKRVMDSDVVDVWVKDARDTAGVIVSKPFLVDGFRVFFNNAKEIKTPEDLAGLKMRTPAWPILMGTVEEFGANPVSMSWGEVYLAISTGTVDGAESLAPTIISNKLYEVAKYISKDFHQYSPALICVNPDIYASLSDTERDIFDRAVKEGSEYEVNWAIDNDDSFYDELASKGMTVTEVDLDVWTEAAAPVWEEFKSEVDQSLVDKIVELRDAE